MVRPPQPSHAAQLHALRDWLRPVLSPQPPSLRVHAHAADRRELRAQRALPAAHALLRVPPSHLISSHAAARAFPIPDIIAAVRRDLLHHRLPDAVGDNAVLLLFVLLHLADPARSFFRPWLRSLPPRFDTPLTLPLQRVNDLLSDTPIYPLILKLRTELREMYDSWFLPYAVRPYPRLFPPHLCTFALFQYAHSLIESRSFRLENLTVLAPFADMANHAPSHTAPCNAKVRPYALEHDPTLGLELYSSRPIAPDEPVCISYGALKNWQLLLHYGFALQHNPDDGIDVCLQPPQHAIDATTLVLHLALGYTDLDFTLTMGDPLPQEMLIALRIIVLDDQERSRAATTDFTKLVSTRNERQVLQYLRSLLQALRINRVFEGAHDAFVQFCAHYVASHAAIVRASSEQVAHLQAQLDRIHSQPSPRASPSQSSPHASPPHNCTSQSNHRPETTQTGTP